MTLLEKKYQVDSFDPILKIIKAKKLKKIRNVTSVHYYGKHEGNDVEKFIEYPDSVKVHIWKEIDGKFTPVDDFPLKDKAEGIAWLKKRGFKEANIVKMDYTEYRYQNGNIGLYTIDDFHKSVILSLPEGKHEDTEKEFGLQDSVIITIPYNKLLERLGKLRTIKLD
jgi:hypothetical protein